MTMRRRLGAAVVAVALVGVVSGCSSSPSTAATVGNTAVAMESVDDAVEHCSKFINPSSDTERDQIVARNGMTALTSDRVCHTMARSFAGLFHLFDLEGEKQAKADLSAVDVKANPRLGSWDAGNLVLRGSSSLSQPFTKTF